MKDVTILTNAGIDINKSLELFGDMTTYDQMLEDFLKEVDGKLESAKKFKEEADMANYAIIVHSLKSDCKYFGIFDLADKFYEHELAGKENNFYFVTTNFDSLMQSAKEKILILNRYMGIDLGPNYVQDEVFIIKEETIIVVDDSNIIRNFMQKIFEGKYDVRLAKDGEEAISLVANTPHEKVMCVFLDLNMPNVDGFAVLEYFKNNNLFDKIPVSIITGENAEDLISRAKAYPIIDVIQKPFNELMIKNAAIKTISSKK